MTPKKLRGSQLPIIKGKVKALEKGKRRTDLQLKFGKKSFCNKKRSGR